MNRPPDVNILIRDRALVTLAAVGYIISILVAISFAENGGRINWPPLQIGYLSAFWVAVAIVFWNSLSPVIRKPFICPAKSPIWVVASPCLGFVVIHVLLLVFSSSLVQIREYYVEKVLLLLFTNATFAALMALPLVGQQNMPRFWTNLFRNPVMAVQRRHEVWAPNLSPREQIAVNLVSLLTGAMFFAALSTLVNRGFVLVMALWVVHFALKIFWGWQRKG